MKAKQQKIFDSVLSRVSSEGWTATAFDKGAKKAGVSLIEATGFFPNQIDDIAQMFWTILDDEMLLSIKKKRSFVTLKVRDKISFALRAHLEASEKYREQFRRILTWSLLPRNVAKSTRTLWTASDKIWSAAGDTSTDYNHYTKRLLLIAVMKSVVSFWLQDESVGRKETWEFLDRRIADVMKVGKGLNILKSLELSDIASFVKARWAS